MSEGDRDHKRDIERCAMSLPMEKKGQTFTYGDYLTWSPEERWELLEGAAHAMTPSPTTLHQEVLREFSREFSTYLRGKVCKVFFAPFDVRLPEGDEADESVMTVVQPDLVVVCDRAKVDEKGCRGAPDLVMEILSPATARRDMKDKLDLYEKAGVREYWIVHPVDRTVMVFALLENRQYGKPAIYSEEDDIKVGIFDDLTVRLKTIFGS
jgi:Uma2 family endonuclease